MHVSQPRAGIPKQLWLVLLMALALALVWWLLRDTPNPEADRPTLTATPTAQSAGNQTPRPPTRPVPSPTPTLAPPTYADHLILERPIAADYNDWVARFYPYASRGDGTYPPHHGVEFVNATGTPVRAVSAGTVVYAGTDERTVWGARASFYGNLIILQLHETYLQQPIYCLYGHLSKIEVSVGQRVELLEPIGEIGSTGVAEGPHLHFEVRVGDNNYRRTANPELWLAPHSGRGTLVGQAFDSDGVPIREALIHLYDPSNLNVPLREITTYPASDIASDPAWQEHFCSGDLAAGDYVVRLYNGGRYVDQPVTVVDGQCSLVRFGTGSDQGTS